MLLGRDFRQVLPVIEQGSRRDFVEVCLKMSVLWSLFEIQKLITYIGNFWEALNGGNSDFSVLAILTPKNVDALRINDYVLDRLSGDKIVFLSDDEAMVEVPSNTLNFPTKFLNKMTPTGMPPKALNLKVGCMVMLLRNLDVGNGLCNGTRPIVRSIGRRVLVCEHAVGSRKGSQVLLPRIDGYFSQNLPFRLRRRQFPIRLLFAMTINKFFVKVLNDRYDALRVPRARRIVWSTLARDRNGNAVGAQLDDQQDDR
ncbi:unnamed protein product [Heligmosomoides polygyrus]|uniref:ATP-dependent DNA helicase n=1 Tax=Heligmosomoides polygyrus TaxID=6339 RepID=A0A183FK73_HELPZ|nr:unnamed protein product [Heligmosomoides polygyrus]